MAKKKKKQQCSTKRPVEPGHRASSSGKTLRTYDVGALPIINRILQRMRLSDTLRQCSSERRFANAVANLSRTVSPGP